MLQQSLLEFKGWRAEQILIRGAQIGAGHKGAVYP